MTCAGMPSHLIVLVIVHPLDNVDFPRLKAKMMTRMDMEKSILQLASYRFQASKKLATHLMFF